MNFITKIQTICCLLLICSGLANAQITCQSGVIRHYTPNMVAVVNATDLVVNPYSFGTYDFALAGSNNYASSQTFPCSAAGVQNVVVRWTNPNMVVYTCTTTVTLRDTLNYCSPPVQCQNFTATLDPSGTVMVSAARFVANYNANATYTVALTGTSQSGSSLNFSCSQLGTHNVTITQVLNNITSTCAATVTINDPNNACPPSPCINPALIDPMMVCPAVYTPVCGCDSVTYSNDCVAQVWYGVSSWTNGPCSSSAPLSVQHTVTPTTCPGVCDGAASLTATGGARPYRYIWANGATASTVSGLCNGIQGVSVVDGSGSVAVVNITVTAASPNCQPAALVCQNYTLALPATTTTVAANQFVPNPNPNATYLVNYANMSSLNSNLTVTCNNIGTTAVTVQEQLNGATRTCQANIIVTDPNNACATPSPCINPALIDPMMACTAVYTPVCGCDSVTYSNDCVAQVWYGVSSWTNGPCSSSAPLSVQHTVTPTTCPGACDGAASLTATGGARPYRYIWANGATTSTVSGLCNGIQGVSVVDGSGSVVVVNITVTAASPNCQPAGLVCQNYTLALPATTTTVAANQFVSNPNPNATYLVNYANMSSLNSNLTVTCNNIGTTAVTVQEQLNGATHTCQANIVVTDPNNACGNPNGFNCQTQTLTITPNRVAVASASQFVTNPLPNAYYTMSIGTPNGGFSAGGSNYTFSCNEVGTYTVIVSQRANGIIQTCTTSVVVADPNNICAAATPCVNPALIDSNAVCVTIYAPVCGCNGVTYPNDCIAQNWGGVTSWTNGVCPNNNPSNPIVLQYTITPATCAQSNCDGFVNLTTTGGTAPYTYAWSNNTSGNVLRMVCAGTYSVTVTDAAGLTATTTAIVSHSSGCVWPGDTDDDAHVSFFDVLPISLAYGESGFVRPNATINWQGEQCQDWNTVTPIAGLPNYKHIDTDGNGLINQLDVQAVINNYGQYYYRTVSAIGDIPFYINDATVNQGDRVSLPILLGSPAEMADNVYGVAFTIEYDPAAVDAGSLSIDVQNSWLGNDLILAYREDFANGKLNAVIARKDRMNVSNFGEIGTLNLTIRDDILRNTTRLMPINITNVKLIDNQNTILGTTRPEATLSIELASSVSRQNDLQLNVFPNPAQSVINIQSPNAEIEAVRLLNVTGQELLFVANVNQNNSQINISELPSGIYMLAIITNKGISTQRVQVKR